MNRVDEIEEKLASSEDANELARIGRELLSALAEKDAALTSAQERIGDLEYSLRLITMTNLAISQEQAYDQLEECVKEAKDALKEKESEG